MTETNVDIRAFGERLDQRIARGSMSFRQALQIATEVAAALRALHASGLQYGALSAQTVLIGASGAGLAPRDELARRAGGGSDVAAFGELMELMLDGAETPGYLLPLWTEAAAVARRCLTEAPEIQQVLIPLRLLGMRARMATPAQSPDGTPGAGLSARVKSMALLAADAMARAATRRTAHQPAGSERH